MSDDWLVILGAGFSKAFSGNMPTMADLHHEIRSEFEGDEIWESKPFLDNIDNFELLLSYLGSNQPWKSISEDYKDKALFKKIKERLAEHITELGWEAFFGDIPDWANNFALLLHEKKIPVITFNYDTILEQLLLYRRDGEWTGRFPMENLYTIPLRDITQRDVLTPSYSNSTLATFDLIKLHGSINWFYSGEDNFPGEQIYYHGLTSKEPEEKSFSTHPILGGEYSKVLKDKQHLIIPPVMEKSQFYSNKLIKSLWEDARTELSKADRILSIGYSLPQTDLTTRMLVNSSSPNTEEVFVVDNDPSKEGKLRENYNKAFLDDTDINTEFVYKGNPASKAVAFLKENVNS
ncbi:MAG: hypothetical protein V5A57_03585 [Candidatus Paceibacterota bacterium]